MRLPVALLAIAGLLGAGCRVGHLMPEEPRPEPGLLPLATPPPEGVLRIASWNVWALPVVSAQLAERLARIPDALRAHDPHVICLQEVWTAAARDQISDALAPRWDPAPAVGGGLMMLARVPIEDVRFVPFAVAPGLSAVERFARKGWIEATVTTGAGPVRLVNTHLALAFGEETPRGAQLVQLLDAATAWDEIPVVLAGDFNTSSVSGTGLDRAYLRILNAGFLDANPPHLEGDRWVRGATTRQGWPRSDARRGWDPDHVFVRSARAGEGPGSATHGIAVAGFHVSNATPETALSDHDLLVVDVGGM